MQPPARRSRPIVSDPRPTGPLVYERLSDPILVRRAKDGDTAALEALCTRHAPRVERIALHVLRDPEDARDAAQDALAKVVQRIAQFRGQSQFSTWLYRLTVNTCKDAAAARFQLQRRTEPLLEDNRPATDHDPERELAASESRRELAKQLSELPAPQARVLALKDAFDLPFEEIAILTGLPVGTAKCYAHRARNGLRARLSA